MPLVKIYTVPTLNTFVYINSFAIFWQCFWRKFTQWNTNQPSISITLPWWIMQWFCCGSFCTTCRLCSWYNFKRPLLTTSTYHFSLIMPWKPSFFLKKKASWRLSVWFFLFGICCSANILQWRLSCKVFPILDISNFYFQVYFRYNGILFNTLLGYGTNNYLPVAYHQVIYPVLNFVGVVTIRSSCNIYHMMVYWWTQVHTIVVQYFLVRVTWSCPQLLSL